jgi:hypothetical protein
LLCFWILNNCFLFLPCFCSFTPVKGQCI